MQQEKEQMLCDIMALMFDLLRKGSLQINTRRWGITSPDNNAPTQMTDLMSKNMCGNRMLRHSR